MPTERAVDVRAARSTGWPIAVFTKYIVPVCVAPSESNSVSEVAWLKEFGSSGSNTAHRRRRGARGQIQQVFDVGGGLRRRVRGLQAQVAEAAGVETAAGERRIGLQALLLRVDHVAVAIHLEGAGARVGQRAAVGDDEHALPAHREVQVRVGELDVALRELLRDGRDAHAVAGGVARHALQRHGEQVGEFGARALEAVGRTCWRCCWR